MPTIRTAVFTGSLTPDTLSLARHLLSLTNPTWRFVFTDANPPPTDELPTLDPARILHLPTSLTSWPALRQLFENTYAWNNVHRIDLLVHVADAVKDTPPTLTDVPTATILDGPKADPDPADDLPTAPSLDVWEHNVTSTIYLLRLFIYFAHKTQSALMAREMIASTVREGVPSADNGFHPKMVVLGNGAGVRVDSDLPQFSASQHALVGLVRSIGEKLLARDDISINMVLTERLEDQMGTREGQTRRISMTTIMRAIEEVNSEVGRVGLDGLSGGQDGLVKGGCIVSCDGIKVVYH